MKEVGWSEKDTCLICGIYVPEGRQVCPYCEKMVKLTIGQVTDAKKNASHFRQGKKRKCCSTPLRPVHCL